RQVDEAKLTAGSDLAVMWKVSKEWMAKKRLDFENAPLEIGLFGHAINGGLVINEHCESSIPGLYAVGETAGGPYGADRLGGNMLLNCQVFGRRAGLRAAKVGQERASRAHQAEAPDLSHILDSNGKKEPKEAVLAV